VPYSRVPGSLALHGLQRDVVRNLDVPLYSLLCISMSLKPLKSTQDTQTRFTIHTERQSIKQAREERGITLWSAHCAQEKSKMVHMRRQG